MAEPATYPTLEHDGWELDSAVERNRRASTFEIPSEAERTHLEVGDLIKLLFLFAVERENGAGVQCERMWVSVKQKTPTGYVGILETLPITCPLLQPGDRIAFAPHHVASLVRRTDPEHPDYTPAEGGGPFRKDSDGHSWH